MLNELKQLSTATFLSIILIIPTTNTNAEIIVGIDDPINPGNIINTDITDIDGNPIDITSNPLPYIIHFGHDQYSSLLINNASTLWTDKSYIGYNYGSSGTVNIQDAGTNWTITDWLLVGHYGQGTLNIKNGATVNASSNAYIGSGYSPSGTVNIQDPNSNLTIADILYVGFNGQATICIKNGATVNATATSIGSNAHITLNNGTLNTGTISSLDPQKISGTGTINLGGEIYDQNITLQNQNDFIISTTILNGINQNIILNTDLSLNNVRLGVGQNGTGRLNIQNGMQINSQDGYIGFNSGSNGTVNMQDPGSSWTIANDLYVGRWGQATLNIKNGATVNAINTFIGSKGHINLNNGTLNTHEIQSLDSQYLTGTGTLNTAGKVYDKILTLQNPSDLHFTQTLNGTDQNITHNTHLSLNNVRFGAGQNGTGTLNIQNGIQINSQDGYIGFNSGSNGTVNIQDTDSSWTIENLLYVAFNGQAILNIKNGATVNTNGEVSIGYKPGSSGTINIEDARSSWRIANRIYIGRSGQATLNIKNGATFGTNENAYIGYYASSNSNVNIQDAESNWIIANNLYVGHYSQATLNIKNGATVSTNDFAYIGFGSGASGTVNMQGTDSNWEITNRLFVGSKGQGTLDIKNGAAVNSDIAIIGDYVGSSGTVNIQDADSNWKITDWLTVGRDGQATLNIKDGATVNCNNASIASSRGVIFNSSSTVNVQGLGSKWTITSNLDVGRDGQATLNIKNGATVNSSSASIATKYNSISSGTVNVQGPDSKWAIAGELSIGHRGNATFNIQNGATVTSGKTTISESADSNSIVNLQGSESAWTANSIHVGSEGGQSSININDNAQLIITEDFYIYDMQASKLSLTLSSPSDTFIDIGRDAYIAGDLNIFSSNLIDLTLEDTFILLDISGELTGTFDNLDENDIAAYFDGLALRLTYQGGDGNDIALYVTQAPELGDTNDDGQINQLDLDLVQQHLGTNNYLGDANHDGTVNLEDLFAVRNNFANTTSIPEPATLFTLLVLAPLTLIRRK